MNIIKKLQKKQKRKKLMKQKVRLAQEQADRSVFTVERIRIAAGFQVEEKKRSQLWR